MKKIILSVFILITSGNVISQNNKVLQNNNTKTNINTTNNNSNSGVNPNGNPGTIISSSAISGAQPPTTTSPYPPTQTSQYFTDVQENLPLTNDTVVATEPLPQVAKVPETTNQPEELKVVEVKRVSKTGDNMKTVKVFTGDKKTFVPVNQTYIPNNVVQDIKKKFGDNVYDIVLLKSKDGKQVYVVRIAENGVFRTETFYY